MWRGETFAATAAEYFAIKTQLASETYAAEAPGGPPRFFTQLPQEERAKLLKERLKKYCQRVRTVSGAIPTDVRKVLVLQGLVFLYAVACSPITGVYQAVVTPTGELQSLKRYGRHV